MAYVDLNPIRAGLTQTPENSDYTSIQTRLGTKPVNTKKKITEVSLLPFAKGHLEYGERYIPITQAAYFELVDWTGRSIRDGKRGAIPQCLPPILERINLTEHEWLRQTRFFEARFKCVAGTWESIKRAAKKFNKPWFHGKEPKYKPHPT